LKLTAAAERGGGYERCEGGVFDQQVRMIVGTYVPRM
jgi:hypothetical protein